MIEAGTILQNRYLIRDKIGAGGMGAVFVATDQRFGSQVAIKETFFSDTALRRAFEREAQLLNSLRHPALPRVSDHFEEAEGQFLVMEFIAGEDLCEILDRQGSFAVADVLLWADQLLDALDYLHSQKTPIVHRDIKPQNLKITPRGDIVLLDFGLAKGSITDVSKLTQTKSVFGYSRAYAPLEQIQGTGTDPRSDLYSLAATLYHLLTGAAPVDALTRAMAVLNGSEDSLRPANEKNPQVPAAVAAVLHQAMSLNAAARPQTAAMMREALTEAANNPDFNLSESTAFASNSANLFTQNTQLMGGETKEANQTANVGNRTAPLEAGIFANGSKDSDQTKFARTDVKEQRFATDPQALAQATEIEDAENSKHHAAFRVPVEAPIAATPNVAPKSRSILKPVGVAVAIAVLGAGGFAGWRAMSNASSDVEQPTQNQIVIKNDVPKTDSSGETKQNAVAAPISAPETNANSATNSIVKTAKNPATNEVKPNTQTIIVEKTEKPNAQTKTKAANQAENAAREEKDLTESDDPNVIIPEIRVDDIPNLTQQQREKIRNAIKLERQHETRTRTIERINRKRAEQGLPPLPMPPPPKDPDIDNR